MCEDCQSVAWIGYAEFLMLPSHHLYLRCLSRSELSQSNSELGNYSRAPLLSKVLTDTNKKEESLSWKKQAFDLYKSKTFATKSCQVLSLAAIAMDLTHKPTHSEVILVKGAGGNESFQQQID